MIWETPFAFEPKVDKCIYSFVMEKLRHYAMETPDRKVLITAENTSNYLTYTQLLDQIRAVEVFLDEIGFSKGQIGTVYMPNNIEIIPFYLAVLGRGGIYSGISPMFTKYEVHTRFSGNGTPLVFTTKALLDNVKYFMEKERKRITIIVLDKERSCENITAWSDVISTKGESVNHSNDINDIAALPHSSGTTGLPKGVMLSHYNLLSAVLNMVLNTNSIWDCVQVLSFPSYHISGKYIILGNLIGGSTTVIMESFDLRLYLETIQKFKVWNLILSPAVLLQLIKDPTVQEYDLSSLGYVSSGGAALGADLAREFVQKFQNIKLTQIYGMSECINPFLVRCTKKNNYATIGCVSPGFQAKVIDIETGSELGPNDRGELIFRGPSVMRGYLNQAEATKQSVDEDGWLHTGDVGYINDDGEVFLVDRKKELMKVNGASIAPAEIESVLASNNRIKDVGVCGVPNAKCGEIPCAFIVKNDPDLGEEDVRMLIRERIAHYKWPEGVIVFVNEIPKLPSGKILRRQLKEMVV